MSKPWYEEQLVCAAHAAVSHCMVQCASLLFGVLNVLSCTQQRAVSAVNHMYSRLNIVHFFLNYPSGV